MWIKHVKKFALGCSVVGMILCSGAMVHGAEKSDNANSFRYENGEIKDQGVQTKKSSIIKPTNATAHGIDISYHNGTINWQKAKNSLMVDYAIIRAGYGMDMTSQDDKQWENNVKGCETYKIPYGAYIYSYANTVEKAKSEADHMIRLLKGKNLSYPIYYDMEDESTQGKCSNSELGKIATAFLTRMEAAGYKNLGVYANKSWFTEKLTASVFSKYPRWVAQYNTTCTYSGSYHMWQYSEYGTVPGISGAVDLNYKIGKWTTGTVTTTPSVQLNKSSMTLTNGASTSLKATIASNDGKQAVTWKSSKTSIATVSSTGVVKAKSPGSAVITATLTNGKKASCTVKVKPKTTSISSLKKSGKKAIKLTWAKSTGSTRYEVYMSTKKSSGYKKIKNTSYKIRYYTKSSLTTKKRYYFKVRSYKTVGSSKIYSSYSAIKSIVR